MCNNCCIKIVCNYWKSYFCQEYVNCYVSLQCVCQQLVQSISLYLGSISNGSWYKNKLQSHQSYEVIYGVGSTKDLHFRLVWNFLFFLFSSPEPKAHWWTNSIPVTPASVRPSVVRQHFQTSSPLKLLGQLNSYFIWRLLRMGERKFVQMVLVTWPRWPPRPYMVKTLKKSSSPEPEGGWPWDLVCSIGVVGPTKFVQMMILGWPWPT